MSGQDIQKLLKHCEGEIKKLSAQAVQSGQLNEVALKNTLENMRSALDYVAQDVAAMLESKGQKIPKKIYFPYGQNEAQFNACAKSNLPSLDKLAPNIYYLIEGVQRFKSGDNWLFDLADLTNDVKHHKLSKIDVQKTATVRQGNFIHAQGRNIVMRDNVYFDHSSGSFGVLDDVYIDGDANVVVTKHPSALAGGVETEISINTLVMFRGRQLQVVPFLEKCHGEILALTTAISGVL